MGNEMVQSPLIDELLSSDAGQKISQIAETVSVVQQGLCALAANEDSAKLDLLKIGTVFQIFFIDVLASGKKAADLTKDDWKGIVEKVCRYVVFDEGQKYCEFVFSLYANYIDISTETLRGSASEKNLSAIKDLSDALRENAVKMKNGEIDEAAYIEACLWLSLEAMLKLLSFFFTRGIPKEYAELLQSLPQLTFEYGRYVLYSEEQAILEKYIQNQHALDEQLQREYEIYLEEVRTQAETFQNLINDAFSPDIREALDNSAKLARTAGVKEEEILMSPDDVDAFFLD